MFVHIHVHCGCGARFGSIDEAMKHAVQTEHAMDISGKIDPREVKPSGQPTSSTS